MKGRILCKVLDSEILKMIDVNTANSSGALRDLMNAFHESPEPTIKVNTYFPVYADLFKHLIGANCTFIEVGVLSGGSLFMWRKWLGEKARIIGIDLNPEAVKWRGHGFEIYIGDQADPNFWKNTFKDIGSFDVLLDDGGHQSFQQIITAVAAIQHAKSDCLVVVEDTCTSFMKEFEGHGNHSFLEYAKAATDNLTAKDCNYFTNQFPDFQNIEALKLFKDVYSIQFFSGLVSFNVRKSVLNTPSELIWNKEPATPSVDFRYEGKNQANINWPDPKCSAIFEIKSS